MFELVREEKAKGTCVLYTTHYMEEAEKPWDELAIIDHGKIIALGTLNELRAEFGGNDIIQLQKKGRNFSVATLLVFSNQILFRALARY